jgi:hypothetical protein
LKSCLQRLRSLLNGMYWCGALGKTLSEMILGLVSSLI